MKNLCFFSFLSSQKMLFIVCFHWRITNNELWFIMCLSFMWLNHQKKKFELKVVKQRLLEYFLQENAISAFLLQNFEFNSVFYLMSLYWFKKILHQMLSYAIPENQWHLSFIYFYSKFLATTAALLLCIFV